MAGLQRYALKSGIVIWILLAACLALLPLSGRLLTVQSNSMAPSILKGDALLVRRAAEPEVGAIVSYRTANGIITHRVIAHGVGGVVFTQGDANEVPDSPVSTSQIIGTAAILFPGVGTIIDGIRSPIGLVIGVYVPILLLAASETRNLVVAYRRPTYRLAEA